MSPAEAVVALSAVAAQAGVEVRIERFDLAIAGKGGLCRIDGHPVVLVDAKLGSLEQAGVIGSALAALDLGRNAADLPRDVRAYLRTGHAEVRPLVKLRPLARAARGKRCR